MVSASGGSTVFDGLTVSNYSMFIRRFSAMSKLAPVYSRDRLLMHFFSAGADFVQFVSSVIMSFAYGCGSCCSFSSLWMGEYGFWASG